MDLTAEQQATVAELQAELRDLHLEQDARWKEYVKKGTKECYDAALAISSEVEMKALIAHIPKVGEKKVGKIKGLLDKVRGDAACPDCDLPGDVQARLDSLDTVNAWREEHGLPVLDRLPRGVMGDATDCVLARAFMPGDDKIRWEGEDWNLSEIHIGGGGDNRLIVYRNRGDGWGDTYRTIELPTSEAMDTLITRFDAHDYYDLVDIEELLPLAVKLVSEENYDDHLLQAIFEAGAAQDLVRDTDGRVQFEYGVFWIADEDGDEAHRYRVDTEFSMSYGATVS